MPMETVLGVPVQVAYAVDDVERAAVSFAERHGAGPFFVRHHPPFEATHNGAPAVFRHSSAYGQWGEMQVELVQFGECSPVSLQRLVVANIRTTSRRHVRRIPVRRAGQTRGAGNAVCHALDDAEWPRVRLPRRSPRPWPLHRDLRARRQRVAPVSQSPRRPRRAGMAATPSALVRPRRISPAFEWSLQAPPWRVRTGRHNRASPDATASRRTGARRAPLERGLPVATRPHQAAAGRAALPREYLRVSDRQGQQGRRQSAGTAAGAGAMPTRSAGVPPERREVK